MPLIARFLLPCDIFSAYRPAEPSPLLVDFEKRTGLGPTFAARLLGIPYISYAQYRSGTRTMKLSMLRHIEVILLLSERARADHIRKALHGIQDS